MPPKATGKQKATAKEEKDTTTPAKKPRQRRSASNETSSSASTATPIASPTGTPASSSSPSSSSSSSSSSAGSVYKLKVELLNSHPLIWRRILVHSSTTLAQLHVVLQIVVGWQQCHMHVFRVPLPDPPADASEAVKLQHDIAGYREFRPMFGDEALDHQLRELDIEELDERDATIGGVLPAVNRQMVYEYDMGDGWEHLVWVEAIEPATRENSIILPRCIGGRCAGPPEDSQGMVRHRYMVHKYRKENGLLSKKEMEIERKKKQKKKEKERRRKARKASKGKDEAADESDEEDDDEEEEEEKEEKDVVNDDNDEDKDENEDDEDDEKRTKKGKSASKKKVKRGRQGHDEENEKKDAKKKRTKGKEAKEEAAEAEEKEEEENDDDEESEDDDPYEDTVDGWLEYTEERLGHPYDPLHFSSREVNDALEEIMEIVPADEL